jgi:hypothetical protein
VIAGAEKTHSKLHPEKPWFCVSGRGFDSRHLHNGVFAKLRGPSSRN